MQVIDQQLDRLQREALGARLRAVRKASGKTLKELGEASQTPPETLCRIELGRRWVQLPTLLRITEALGVRVSDLLRRF